ncbi:hypothetical protein ANOBCDAF_04449 [Pleomorphomonas sp. T1.2MG-36]|uniref:DUF4865 family protein n=1 Tax=Pleomorphomonas sp. T1.2MG-36 TaxID=3041167 RepID=UPI002477B351|nr:DUF4865 family protein [Pleomorphomonas sp. T1.2MG-36]CAI9403591.1 hypothetical protein ANOBCDAF_04449 [Pleomorphomonas sp. T1.2MG-36]
MIAMQYGFTLPADYDMSIIDRRIRDKGPLLDGFPRLVFKAYLAARIKDDGFESAENLYAPFYLWDEPEGIDAFLSSPGFAALTADFGWPSVATWLVWDAQLAGDLKAARYASREIATIPPHANLADIRDAAIAESRSRTGALATVTGFDPTAWRSIRLSLWSALPATSQNAQIYTVGHVALG